MSVCETQSVVPFLFIELFMYNKRSGGNLSQVDD